MSRLPQPGGDDSVWGNVLNDFLKVEHNDDGSLKPGGSLAQKYTRPVGGIPKADLDNTVQQTLTNADANDPSYAVNIVASSGGALTLPATYAAHKVTLSASCTFTFSAPSKPGHTFVLYIAGAFVPSFPIAVKWDQGSAPSYVAPSLYTFTTFDGGTTWIGSQSAKGIA